MISDSNCRKSGSSSKISERRKQAGLGRLGRILCQSFQLFFHEICVFLSNFSVSIRVKFSIQDFKSRDFKISDRDCAVFAG
jgi:hypothetical protein